MEAVTVHQGGSLLSHVMFADDLILFGEANTKKAKRMLRVLKEFGKASGQALVAEKSSIFFSVNCSQREISMISEAINIKYTKDLGKYLGVQIIHDRSSIQHYQDIIDKMAHRLHLWSNHLLSLAGRTTLERTTLAGIPMYSMKTTALPRKMCKDMDRIIRQFIWGGTNGHTHTSLVHWSIVTTNEDKGGLGIKSMSDLNDAMLMKATWELLTDGEVPWIKVMQAKYGANCQRNKNKMSRLGRVIKNLIPFVKKHMGITLHNDRSTNFWTDNWLPHT